MCLICIRVLKNKSKKRAFLTGECSVNEIYIKNHTGAQLHSSWFIIYSKRGLRSDPCYLTEDAAALSSGNYFRRLIQLFCKPDELARKCPPNFVRWEIRELVDGISGNIPQFLLDVIIYFIERDIFPDIM